MEKIAAEHYLHALAREVRLLSSRFEFGRGRGGNGHRHDGLRTLYRLPFLTWVDSQIIGRQDCRLTTLPALKKTGKVQ
jgi:hypothetical protein